MQTVFVTYLSISWENFHLAVSIKTERINTYWSSFTLKFYLTREEIKSLHFNTLQIDGFKLN